MLQVGLYVGLAAINPGVPVFAVVKPVIFATTRAFVVTGPAVSPLDSVVHGPFLQVFKGLPRLAEYGAKNYPNGEKYTKGVNHKVVHGILLWFVVVVLFALKIRPLNPLSILFS